MSWICGAHHVLRVPHLLRELWHAQSFVLLRIARCQRSEPYHEEVEAREGDEIHGELAEIRVQLAGEPQATGDARHGAGDQVVQIADCSIQKSNRV